MKCNVLQHKAICNTEILLNMENTLPHCIRKRNPPFSEIQFDTHIYFERCSFGYCFEQYSFDQHSVSLFTVDETAFFKDAMGNFVIKGCYCQGLIILPFTVLMYKRESKNTIKQALCMLPYVPDTIKSLAIWFNTQPKPEYWRLKKQHTTVHSTFHINVTLQIVLANILLVK